MIGRTLCLLVAVNASFAETPDELRALIRQMSQRSFEADSRLPDSYSFLRTTVQRDLNSDGAIKSEHTLVARRYFVDGFGFTRLVERDGKPIPLEERQSSEAALQKRLAELKAMSPEDLARLSADGRQRDRTQNAWWKDFSEALDFRKAGEETIRGRLIWVLEFAPRPGYKGSGISARLAAKLRGKLWMDRADTELMKADAEIFETVSVGLGIVGKIGKGSRFSLQRHKEPDGAWLPDSQISRFSARVILVKTVAQERTVQYSEYQRKPTTSVATSASR